MDKKNILALSIIAIAVLLIAVISSSFAYFSVVGSNTTATTNISGVLPNVGTVGTTGGVTLSLNLTAADMSYSNKGKTYYAQTASKALSGTPVNHTIANMAVSGGASGLTYSCDGKITISLPTDSNTIKSKLTAGSLFVKLTKGAGMEFTDSGTEIDLSTAKDKDIEKTFTYTLNGTTTSTSITGDVYFKNTEASQNTLSNSTINVKIDVVTTSCNVK